MSVHRWQGYVLADKPIEWGSARLVGQLRRTLLEQSTEVPSGRRKRPAVGHTGTLDRFASGLMLLLVGRCTSLADFFLHADKTYLADFAFGQSTNTHDCTGEIDQAVPEQEARAFFESRLDDIQTEIQSFVNCTQQQPPLFSALKQEGRRYSDRARADQGFQQLPPARPIRVYASEITYVNSDTLRIQARMHVSGGTYIRSFARDLGIRLGIPVHLAALRRIALGEHELDQDGIWQPEEEGDFPVIRPITAALPHWPVCTIGNKHDFEALRNGQRVDLANVPDEGRDFFVVDGDGQTLAWARSTGRGAYRYSRVFLE